MKRPAAVVPGAPLLGPEEPSASPEVRRYRAPRHREDEVTALAAVALTLAVAVCLVGASRPGAWTAALAVVGPVLLGVLLGAVVGTALAGRTGAPASVSSLRAPGHRARRRRRRVGAVGVVVAALASAGALALAGWTGVALLGASAAAFAAGAVAAGRARPLPSRPLRWVPAIIVLVAVSPWAWGLSATMTAEGPDPLSIRAVEWLRDHGAAGAVNAVEGWWFTHHPPPTGGRPAQLPRVSASPSPSPIPTPTTSAPGRGAQVPVPPAPVPSPVTPLAPGEGQWVTLAGSPSRPAVATTLVRPDAVHTSVMVGVLRLDPSQVQLSLVAGTEMPGGPAPTGGAIPRSAWPGLIAVFNAGFRMQESAGGWFSGGRTAQALRDGAASLVLRDDGRADVGQWGRDVGMDPHVTAVRQNLTLLVDGGAVVPGTDDDGSLRWGKTLGHSVLVDRSGVGVTADGALVYVGGPALSVTTLARTLVAAGAVRGMELDINHQWVAAGSFTAGPTAPVGHKLVEAMRYAPDHFLAPQSRDFVAVELRPGVPRVAA